MDLGLRDARPTMKAMRMKKNKAKKRKKGS